MIDAHGVPVTVVRSQQALLDQPAAGADTTVIVTGTDQLSGRTAQRMLEAVRGARRVVLVEPAPYLLAALDLPVQVRNADRSTVQMGRDSRRMVQDLLRVRRWSSNGTYERRRAELPGR